MNDMFKMFMHGGMISDDICIPTDFIKLIFTILFPPIGVWIDQHGKGYPSVNKIGISLILTAMFYFPGLMYGLNTISFS
jgi:uncharacterized membrane protein YqaE (UPF0057 family)